MPMIAAAGGTQLFYRDWGGSGAPVVRAILGTADVTVPIEATAHRLMKLVPGVRLTEYDGAPHGLPATRAERLTKDLLAHLG